MKRRHGSGSLSLAGAAEEDINPMDGVANLADVMLVFACGLILALITFWNVDVAGIARPVDIDRGPEITDMQGLDDEGNPLDDNDLLEEYGTVYRDAEGNYYMVTKD
ncbi:MAG: DUF2149 domain-containing protein [Oscillospiraceae bacterium]|nr:DUF2149 domain-containing protein [Oscillospiraceae bacterium]